MPAPPSNVGLVRICTTVCVKTSWPSHFRPMRSRGNCSAVRLRKHYWMVGLLAIAVLFNPLAPLPVSSTLIMGLELACTLAFLASLFALRSQPILSIVSITDRTPGSESL